MSVPVVAFYSSTANGIGLGSHHFGHFGSSHGYRDSYPNTRISSATAAASSCYGQRPMVGALSCLTSSSSGRHASAPKLSFASDLGLPRLERHNELGTSFSSSPCSFSFKFRDHSPLNVFLSPVSCSGGEKTGATSSSRISGEWSDLRSGRDRIFNGFVRNALGSCLDYGSSTIPLPGADSDLGTEEFPFVLSDSMCEEESYASDLLSGAKSRHIIFNDDLVVKAFYEAEKAHRGQTRMSGDPYLQHCLETAVLLAKIGANSTVVAAGLLHDTVDDSYVTPDYIYREFGADVADLVEGVSKLSQLSKLARENNIASQTVEIDRLHTMFIGMTDTRAVLIKLADRLHNMITLESLPVVKQQRLAKETLEIFAPLANRLGISSWKEQLENLCFKHLYPEQYNMLCSKLLRCFNQEMVASSVKELEKTLKDENISYHVLSGRHKSLYSIYLKMLKKNQTINEIHDIHGLRLIVANEEDCYAALDIVHKLWSEVPGRFKDYIMDPKLNGYKSLHTIVLNENMVPLEVQIRTKEMHLQAEFGFAAHWRYKEGDCELSSFVLQMVEWARWVVSWQCETMNVDRPSSFGDDDSIRPPCPFPYHSDDCPFSYNHHYNHGGPVCIIMLENDKMSVQEFPANSTVMDLLDRVGRGTAQWHAYGFTVKEELRPRLNRELMSNPSQKLRMGDLVELTPAIPEEVLTECREEMQRMYDRDFTVLSS